MAALMSLRVVTGRLLHSLGRFWLMPQGRVDVLLEHTTAAVSLWVDPLLSCFPRPHWKGDPK